MKKLYKIKLISWKASINNKTKNISLFYFKSDIIHKMWFFFLLLIYMNKLSKDYSINRQK